MTEIQLIQFVKAATDVAYRPIEVAKMSPYTERTGAGPASAGARISRRGCYHGLPGVPCGCFDAEPIT